jgi:toxin YoeB
LSILELERLPGKSTQILQDASDRIVELIRNKPDIGISELAYLTGTTERTVKRFLQKLVEAGTIRTHGIIVILRRLPKTERHGKMSAMGIGKPEKLKGRPGQWSRRIDDYHRLVYKIEDDIIKIIECGKHYGE